MTYKNDYIIQGGKEGKNRLQLLGAILNQTTRSLLESEGPITGKRFLDMGSGGGNVSLMAAQMVGNTGHVTAIDFDEEIIALAQADARAASLHNISYRALNAYDLDYEAEFDIAYARFLLSHLQQPEIVLQKMIRSLKPGGRLIVEDIDFSGHFCYPASPAFQAYLHYFTTAARNNGQNPDIGLSLVSLCDKQELEGIGFDIIQPFHKEGPGKWMAYFTMDKIKEAVLRQKLADSPAIEKTLTELKNFTENPQSVISLPRIFRVWGIAGNREGHR